MNGFTKSLDRKIHAAGLRAEAERNPKPAQRAPTAGLTDTATTPRKVLDVDEAMKVIVDALNSTPDMRKFWHDEIVRAFHSSRERSGFSAGYQPDQFADDMAARAMNRLFKVDTFKTNKPQAINMIRPIEPRQTPEEQQAMHAFMAAARSDMQQACGISTGGTYDNRGHSAKLVNAVADSLALDATKLRAGSIQIRQRPLTDDELLAMQPGATIYWGSASAEVAGVKLAGKG